MESWTLVRMDDFGCKLSLLRSLTWKGTALSILKSIDDNKYVLVAMCVLCQRSNVMHFEWGKHNAEGPADDYETYDDDVNLVEG